MYSLTFIGHDAHGKPVLHALTSPSGVAIMALYWAMFDAGWNVRVWGKDKRMIA